MFESGTSSLRKGITTETFVEPFNFLFIHSSMPLQSFVGPWPLLQFRNLFYTVGRTPCSGDQPVARPLPTHRTAQTQTARSL
jgi:hypothetical protein